MSQGFIRWEDFSLYHTQWNCFGHMCDDKLSEETILLCDAGYCDPS